MKGIINNFKKIWHMEIRLTTTINFVSSKDTDEEHIMHWNSDNIEIIIYNKADEVIKELFKSLLKRYQIGFETSMKSRNFIFDCVHLLYKKCYNVSLNRGGYIGSLDWTNDKKAIINPINDDDNTFNTLQQLR